MAVTRDDVIQTAIQLLQEVGLEGLTLRRLATELGISAPTLYWHVRNKRELLDLMGAQMILEHRAKQPPMPAGLDWADRIAEIMRRQYQTITAFRDGARVVAGNRPTEKMLPMIERYLGMWVEIGFPPEEALATLLAIGDFVAGAALESQAEMERQRDEPLEKRLDTWRAYPTLLAAAAGRAKLQRPDNFERGLALLIAGLRARHAELMAEKQSAPTQQSAPAELT